MRTTYISFIKDLANLSIAKTELLPPTISLVYFEGSTIQIDPINRIDFTIKVEMGKERAEPKNSTVAEGATTISASVMAFTFSAPLTHSYDQDVAQISQCMVE